MSEDLKPSGDVTTRLIQNNKKIKAKIISNQNCVIGGLSFVKEAFKYSDKKVVFKPKSKDGRKINKGKVVAIVYGRAKGILESERVALNFLSLISGVATITKKFVDKVKGKSCKICCTRKTAPNLRSLQKYGVKLGGGLNHRFNLSDEILIKDNHIAIDGNIRELVKRALKNKKGKKINASNFEKELYTKNIPDPEILIRTGGTKRLSNFLLWQLAYTEIFFVDKLWPDFNENDFNRIIIKFNKIKRNFGKI